MAYQNFKELRVWQETKSLAVDIYKMSAKGELSKDYGLRDQMRRSAVSIVSNVAEGYERNSDKEFIRFLMISKGSIAELRTQLDIAHEISYVEKSVHGDFENRCNTVGSMITKLIQSRMKRE